MNDLEKNQKESQKDFKDLVDELKEKKN